MTDSRYWVGERKGSHILWVFDQNVIHSDPEMVYLYNSKNKTLESHPKNFARSVLNTVKDERSVNLIAEYKSWFSLNGPNFLIQDQSSYEGRKRETEKWLASRKLERNGTLNGSRAPQCYACGNQLNGTYNKKCDSCGWLVCTCGTCGCGYTAF